MTVSSVEDHRRYLRAVVPTALRLGGPPARSQNVIDLADSWTRSGLARCEPSRPQEQRGSAGSSQQVLDEAAFFPMEEPLNVGSLQIERMLKRRTYLGRCSSAKHSWPAPHEQQAVNHVPVLRSSNTALIQGICFAVMAGTQLLFELHTRQLIRRRRSGKWRLIAKCAACRASMCRG